MFVHTKTKRGDDRRGWVKPDPEAIAAAERLDTDLKLYVRCYESMPHEKRREFLHCGHTWPLMRRIAFLIRNAGEINGQG